MLVGFASLSFAGYRAKRRGRGSKRCLQGALSLEGTAGEASWPRAHVYGLPVFRNGEHVFEGFRRYVHRTTERVVQGDDDNQAGRENDR